MAGYKGIRDRRTVSFPAPDARWHAGTSVLKLSCRFDCNGKERYVVLKVRLFADTIDRHFKWMAEYGIHGVFLQRFVCELEDPKLRYARDMVANRVRLSAEKYGRCFAVMYDTSGSPSTTMCAG